MAPTTDVATGSATVTLPSDLELVVTRVLDAPRELAFAAFTQPEHMRRWLLGVEGWTMPVCDLDLRAGGAWRWVQRAPDGTEHSFSGVYREVVSPEKLVYTESHAAMPDRDYLVTLTFTEQGGKTTLSLATRYRSQEDRDKHLAAGEEGMKATLDRLNAYLQTLASTDTSDREIAVSRLVNAPRELVWQAWTDPEQIGEWWGPYGFTTTTFEMDVTPGGRWRYIMHGPDGTDYPNLITYDEVMTLERLTYAHGASDDEPAHFHATVTFKEQAGKTLVTLRQLFPTVKARDAGIEFGVPEGGRQTLERLDTYLAGKNQ